MRQFERAVVHGTALLRSLGIRHAALGDVNARSTTASLLLVLTSHLQLLIVNLLTSAEETVKALLGRPGTPSFTSAVIGTLSGKHPLLDFGPLQRELNQALLKQERSLEPSSELDLHACRTCRNVARIARAGLAQGDHAGHYTKGSMSVISKPKIARLF